MTISDSESGSARPADVKQRSGAGRALVSEGAGWSELFSTFSWKDAAVPLTVLAIVVAMITPVPAMVLDLLISANITLSVVSSAGFDLH
jgi:hypothetical protein